LNTPPAGRSARWWRNRRCIDPGLRGPPPAGFSHCRRRPIASAARVSVILAHRGPLEESVLCRSTQRPAPPITSCGASSPNSTGSPSFNRSGIRAWRSPWAAAHRNQAIRFREQAHEGVNYLDFGEEWWRAPGCRRVCGLADSPGGCRSGGCRRALPRSRPPVCAGSRDRAASAGL